MLGVASPEPQNPPLSREAVTPGVCVALGLSADGAHALSRVCVPAPGPPPPHENPGPQHYRGAHSLPHNCFGVAGSILLPTPGSPSTA